MNSFEKTKSFVKAFDPSADISEEIKNYTYVLAIYTDRVEINRGADAIATENLVELRAFSSDKELHIIRIGTEYRGRYRYDNSADGASTEYYEEKQLMWGNAEKDNPGIFTEDRGIILNIPVNAEPGDRAFLEVRNYLDSESFEFVDYRLCGITTGKAVKYDAR